MPTDDPRMQIGDVRVEPFGSGGDATATLTARYPGRDAKLKPLLLLGQLDVVEAKREDWQRDPSALLLRIFPGVSFDSVKETLKQVVADSTVQVAQIDAGTIESPTSALRADVVTAVRRAVHASYPKLTVVPTMSAGATDGMHFRARGVPVYGVSGVYMKPSDDFSHGLNERVPLATIDLALAHWESLLRDLAR